MWWQASPSRCSSAWLSSSRRSGSRPRREIATRQLLLGAVVAAVGWQVLTLAGSWLLGRQVSRASETYGTFAVVIGLVTWLYLAAVVSVVALEIDVVRDRGLWPRSLFTPPLTEADERTFESLAEQEQRTDGQTIDVRFDDVPSRPAASG